MVAVVDHDVAVVVLFGSFISCLDFLRQSGIDNEGSDVGFVPARWNGAHDSQPR